MDRKKLIIIVASVGLTMFLGCNQTLPDYAIPIPKQNVKTGKWGFVYQKKIVIKFMYDNVDNFSSDLARVESEKVWGYIDKTGKEVIPLKFDFAANFKDDLAKVGLNGKFGYIDKSGKETILLKYDEVDDFKDGLAKAKLNGKQGFVDKSGKEIIPLIYTEIGYFTDGLSKALLDGKYGYLNKEGDEVVPFEYESLGIFSDGLAKVSSKGKYGFIDMKGKVIIPLIYESADNFSNESAKVQRDGWYHYINKKGETLPGTIELEFHYLPVGGLAGFIFRDVKTKQTITYKKLVIDGQTVISSRYYMEPGMNGMNVVEFFFRGGRYIGYSLAVGYTKKLSYNYENGTLYIL